MSIKLTSLDRKELQYVTELVVTAKGVTNRVKLNQLDVSQGPMAPVVNEFLNAFPKEFPGMPPDRDIKFVIDLMSGIVPMYKRPHRMATQQLTKLKEHIMVLLEKGYIRPSLSPWRAPVLFVLKKDGTQRLCVH
jgi:hypothetical protein